MSTPDIKKRQFLPISTKIAYGIGSVPGAVRGYAFSTFLLFFYNQVMDVPGTLCGLAMAIALFLDAISDPLIGSLSDNFESRLGRRHPFMYASIAPIAISLYLLFMPPAGLSSFQLFLWMAFFVVLGNQAWTLYAVPWNAMLAEITLDYHERALVANYRYFFGMLFWLAVSWGTMRFLFPTTPEFTPGHLNPAGYPVFATVTTIISATAIFITTHFTRKDIPYLPKVSETRKPFSLRNVVAEFMLALENRMYRLLAITTLVSAILGGSVASLEMFMTTYFWGLNPEEISWLMLAGSVAPIALLLVKPMIKIFDKKHIIIACWFLEFLRGSVLVTLRLFDALPPNGDPWLLRILFISAAFIAIPGIIAEVLFPSIIADVVDEQELETGRRQEGMFFSALSFMGKAIGSLGTILAGWLIDVLRIPQGQNPATVDPIIIRNLGVVGGLVLPSLYFIPSLIFAIYYNISRERHAEIRAELDRRYAAKDMEENDSS